MRRPPSGSTEARATSWPPRRRRSGRRCRSSAPVDPRTGSLSSRAWPGSSRRRRTGAPCSPARSPACSVFSGSSGGSPPSLAAKLCYAPFGKPGSLLIRLLGGKRSRLNRCLCALCIKSAHKHPGGAEVEISALFADVRGSTALAERSQPGEFGQLLTRFYGTAARVVDRWDGIVDKFVGDEAIALFIPGFAGQDHAARAIAAAQELLEKTGHIEAAPWLPVGVGVHTGLSYVGFVGEDEKLELLPMSALSTFGK
jgi:hypothetical protein